MEEERREEEERRRRAGSKRRRLVTVQARLLHPYTLLRAQPVAVLRVLRAAPCLGQSGAVY